MKSDKKRAILLLTTLAIVAGFVLFTSLGGDAENSSGIWTSVEDLFYGETKAREATITKLDRQIREQKKANKESRQICEHLDLWRRYSLPSDPQMSPVHYQAWLNSLLYDCGITGSVRAGAAKQNSSYHLMEFTVAGRASYINWINFLDIFYRELQLQRIQAITIRPINQQDVVDVSMKIQAIALSGASPDRMPNFRADEIFPIDPEDPVTQTMVNRLASADPNDYMVILDRNIFSSSVQDDPMDYATLTSISSINGVPEAHFRVQIPASRQIDTTTGAASAPYEEIIRVQPGHQFRIGRFEGRLVAVYEEDALIVLESSPVSELHGRPEENMIPTDDPTTPEPTSDIAANTDNPTNTTGTNSAANPNTMVGNGTPTTEQWLLSVGDRLVDAFALAGVE